MGFTEKLNKILLLITTVNIFLAQTSVIHILKIFYKFQFQLQLHHIFVHGLSTFKQLLIPSSLEKSGMSFNMSISTYGTVLGMAMPIVMFPSLVVASFSGLLVPEFSRYRAKKDFKRASEIIKIVYVVTITFSLFISILFFCFSKKLSLCFYHSEDASTYIKIFSFLTVFMYLDIAIDSILKGLNAQISVMVINILDLILTVILTYFLVPTFSTFGLIISIFASEFLNFTLSAIKLYLLMHREVRYG